MLWRLRCVMTLGVVLCIISSTSASEHPTLAQEVEGLLQVVSVTGHELPAVRYIRERLGDVPVIQDALGNLVVQLGSGRPRRLIAGALDEPGYVISHIRDDGYLQLSRVGNGPLSALWDQAHEGQPVVIVTPQGYVPGALGAQSIHLATARDDTREPFTVAHAFVDVGAENRADVDALGIRLLDPVALLRRPGRLPGDVLAAPSARSKAAAVAMVHAARQVARTGSAGAMVFAWTTREHLGRRGLERVVQQHGPFDEVYLLRHAGFTWHAEDGHWALSPLREPGTGLLAAGDRATALPHTVAAPHTPPQAGLFTGAPAWGKARLTYLGLPARYPETPVELIALADVVHLIETLTIVAGSDPAPPLGTPALSAPPVLLESKGEHADIAPLLADLLSRYGVSGAEAPVRDRIRTLLPDGLQPHTDAKGNLWVTFGDGPEHLLFVAHMDEVGFQVVSIREDGRLVLRPKGGLYPSLWEAQAALVHTVAGPVPGVFEPRPDWHTATRRFPPDPLTVFTGAAARSEVAALGIRPGQTVTMPRRMRRLGPHRVLARSMDDRVGCAVLLHVLQQLDTQVVRKRITFAWVVEEETGLLGSSALAAAFSDITRVYPVDTFVSSDAPRESPRFAAAPLGHGAVLRALDGGNVMPRQVREDLLALARDQGIALQYGMTGGWTDGTPFLAYGAINIPLSWPGRYSHSPVEVADLRDLEALAQLILTIVQHD